MKGHLEKMHWWMANALVFLSVSTVAPVCSFPSLNFLSAHLASPLTTGYIVIQPALNYSLEEISGQYPAVLESYTYTALVDQTAKSSCGLEGTEKSVSLMMNFYRSKLFRADALNVLFVPCE